MGGGDRQAQPGETAQGGRAVLQIRMRTLNPNRRPLRVGLPAAGASGDGVAGRGVCSAADGRYDVPRNCWMVPPSRGRSCSSSSGFALTTQRVPTRYVPPYTAAASSQVSLYFSAGNVVMR